MEKKFIVSILILLQVMWVVKAEGDNYYNYCITKNTVIYPSFNTIIKVIYISVKYNIKNLINLFYIFSNLPRKQKTQKLPKNYTVILFFNNTENKRKIFTEDLPKRYYYNNIFSHFLELFINCSVNFVSENYIFNNKTISYYFLKPRSSI